MIRVITHALNLLHASLKKLELVKTFAITDKNNIDTIVLLLHYFKS